MKSKKDSKLKIPGPPVGYTDLMDYEIKVKQEAERAAYSDGTKRRYFPLRPSSSGFCSRKLAYQLMEYYGHADYDVPVLEPPTYRLFKLGHSIEYSVLELFKMVDVIDIRYKQAPLTCFEIKPIKKLADGYLVEGSCDACFISDEYKCIMDVKSAKDAFSKAYRTRWTETLNKYREMETVHTISDTAFYVEDVEAFLEELGEDFLLENIIQLNLYACTKFAQERGIDHAVVYKYNKNDSRHYELRFKPSKSLAKAVEMKFNRIYLAVNEKQPEQIPQGYTPGSMHCSFCDYRYHCYEGIDCTKEYFKTWPKKQWPEDAKNLGKKFVDLCENYEELDKSVNKAKQLEDEITKIMHNEKIQRFKLDNGHVYDLKLLKSPKEHYVLRRSKL